MPPEPNDKMEELLKAYAKQRRTEVGAPFEMHPATRQMLHAEVARTMPAQNCSKARKRPCVFSTLGRLFLYGSGLATAVICAALLIKEQNPHFPHLQSAPAHSNPKTSRKATRKTASLLALNTGVPDSQVRRSRQRRADS